MGHVGPAIFVPEDNRQDLAYLLGLTNSLAFISLVETQMAFGSYEVGVIQRTPIPQGNTTDLKKLGKIAIKCFRLKQDLDTSDEVALVSTFPALLKCFDETLAERVTSWSTHVAEIQSLLSANQRTDRQPSVCDSVQDGCGRTCRY